MRILEERVGVRFSMLELDDANDAGQERILLGFAEVREEQHTMGLKYFEGTKGTIAVD
jgi:hypothetical protein